MHGNTESCSGYKTRRYDNIRAEVSRTPSRMVPSCTHQLTRSILQNQQSGEFHDRNLLDGVKIIKMIKYEHLWHRARGKVVQRGLGESIVLQ